MATPRSLVFLTGAVLACTPEVSRTARADRFLEAYNSRRVGEALALVTDDVVLAEPGTPASRSREGLRARMQWDSVMATRFQAGPSRQRGDTVELLSLRQASAWLQLLGIDYLERAAPRFVFRDSLIEKIWLGDIAEENQGALDRALGEFLPWAQHEFPRRLDRVRPDGHFDYRPRYAADLLALLQEWRRPRP